jgi:hypothetical protein
MPLLPNYFGHQGRVACRERVVESDIRFFMRRAAAESSAAMRAVTPAARERRLHLARTYMDRARELRG